MKLLEKLRKVILHDILGKHEPLLNEQKLERYLDVIGSDMNYYASYCRYCKKRILRRIKIVTIGDWF